MKPEIWNKSQLESAGSKTCMEPIELELISIHNMQEAKTNRNGPELKLHGAASGEGSGSPFAAPAPGQGTAPAPPPCASAVLSPSSPNALPPGAGTPPREHSPLQTPGAFWPPDLRLGQCLGALLALGQPSRAGAHHTQGASSCTKRCSLSRPPPPSQMSLRGGTCSTLTVSQYH